jgi:hypothetical protein
MLAESIFFGQWEKPNFREKVVNKEISGWPVYGWNYDVLIGGLYPGMILPRFYPHNSGEMGGRQEVC